MPGTRRRGRAGNSLMIAIATVQSRIEGDKAAYADIVTNNDRDDIIAGLVDLVQLIGRVCEPDTGMTTAQLLEQAFSVEASS